MKSTSTELTVAPPSSLDASSSPASSPSLLSSNSSLNHHPPITPPLPSNSSASSADSAILDSLCLNRRGPLYYPAQRHANSGVRLLSPQLEVESTDSGKSSKDSTTDQVEEIPKNDQFLVPPTSSSLHRSLTATKSDDGSASPFGGSGKRRQNRSSFSRLLRRPKLHSLNGQSPFSSLETSFEEGAANNSANSSNSNMNNGNDSPFSGPSSRRSSSRRRRGRFPSFRGSCDSTAESCASSSSTSGSGGGSSSGGRGELAAGKSNYRIMVLGATRSGKTSIVRQFLYDQFSPVYRETACEDMYRGEFDIHGQVVGFDIQDVAGGYVYEFPGMRNVSLSSADAFVLVFALDDASTWEEVSRLRDMILDVKSTGNTAANHGQNDSQNVIMDAAVPIVVVGNKCDLDADPDVPRDSLEAIVTFDWENGYVESSAKDKRNINKIFKELLQQAKARYDFTVPQMLSASALVSATSARGGPNTNADAAAAAAAAPEDAFKRRQSLPAVPQGFHKLSLHHHRDHSEHHHHGNHRSVDQSSPFGSGSSTPNGTTKSGKRRSSLAALRRDSCKIS